MRVLVTGGAGFVGGALVRKLLARGHDVTVLDNFKTGTRDNVPEGVAVWETAIEQISPFDIKGPFDIVFHLAARNQEMSSLAPFADATTNILGTVRIMRLAQFCRTKKLVYVSSVSVFGDAGVIRDDETVVSPNSAYGISKLAGEFYVNLLGKQLGVKTVVVRLSNVYGPGMLMTSPYVGVVGKFIRSIILDEPFAVYGDGEATRDYTHVDDAVCGILACGDTDLPTGETFNLGTNLGSATRHIAALLAAYDGKPRTVVEIGLRAIDTIRARQVVYEKAEQWLLWRPTVSLGEGLQRTLRWARQTQARKILQTYHGSIHWDAAVSAVVRSSKPSTKLDGSRMRKPRLWNLFRG